MFILNISLETWTSSVDEAKVMLGALVLILGHTEASDGKLSEVLMMYHLPYDIIPFTIEKLYVYIIKYCFKNDFYNDSNYITNKRNPLYNIPCSILSMKPGYNNK